MEQARQLDRPFLEFPQEAPSLAKAPTLPPAALPAIPLRDGDPLEILRVVAQSYSLAPQQIIGKLKLKSISEARQVTCWLLRTRTKLSYPECGRVLHKDHTSVMVCVKKCVARRAKDPSFEAFTDQLATAVEARMKGEAAA
jgi:chromosomal replication initiator protein